MQLILFGAGYWGRHALAHFGGECVYCFCDNRAADGNEQIDGKRIISFNELLEIYRNYVIVVCTGANYNTEVCRQLEISGISDYLIYDVLRKDLKKTGFLMDYIKNGRLDEMFKAYYKSLAADTKAQLDYLKAHVDIMTLRPAEGVFREQQLRLLGAVTEFLEYTSGLGIKPFLTFGNLVGAVRHKGFVPWDDDFDLGLIRSEYEVLMAFAGRECAVGTRCGSVWVDSAGFRMEFGKIFKEYPDRYIFDVRSDMVQVYRSGYGSKPVIDFWIYDFYKDGYDIREHMGWLKEVSVKADALASELDRVNFIRRQRMDNPWISNRMTQTFFPGIDNFRGYPGLKNVDRWISSEDIFPLKKVQYEDKAFWAPKNEDTLLRMEYPDYMDFPYDMGVPLHSMMDERQA